MSENSLFYGSLNLTEIIAQAKAGHSAFSKAENGKIYFNVNVWLNDEPDKYGNSMSIQLGSKKEMKDKEGKIYVGNCKKSERTDPKPLREKDKSSISEVVDDLPF